MATDIKAIIKNLVEFYDFKDKKILSVGAGGGQLVEYARDAKEIFAVDNDLNAIKRLEESITSKGLSDKFKIIHSDFYNVNIPCDVVLFEFCLHEMIDALKAIKHAKTLGVDVVIIDHWKESEWAYFVDEKEKVTQSWSVIESHGHKRFEVYNSVQLFADYNELFNKVSVMGETSIARIDKFKMQSSIVIPMSYVIVQV